MLIVLFFRNLSLSLRHTHSLIIATGTSSFIYSTFGWKFERSFPQAYVIQFGCEWRRNTRMVLRVMESKKLDNYRSEFLTETRILMLHESARYGSP